MLQIQLRRVADVSILDIEGRIAPGEPELAVGRAVAEVVRSGAQKLLLNLDRATSTDTAGISALVGVYLAMREAGGRVKLLKIDRRYAQLLVVVALHTCFDVFESEEEALASFRQAEPASQGAVVKTPAPRAGQRSKVRGQRSEDRRQETGCPA